MPDYRRRLPHFHPNHAYLFLTWRLWRSLPARPPTIFYATPGQAFAAQDRELGLPSSGPVWLKNPDIAELVADAIQRGETEHQFYELYTWVVMPNHVHLLILPEVQVPKITRWLKGSTARGANQFLGRTGQPFWQDESYDHWVRNEKQFVRIARYIEENPVHAGLVESAEDWPWSSAAGQSKTAAPPTPTLTQC